MTSAIIAAGGVGQRMDKDVPKQFMYINGKPLIMYVLDIFTAHDEIDEIIIPCHETYIDTLTSLTSKYINKKPIRIVPAGKNRQESVYNGLMNVSVQTKIILVHDACRPLVSPGIISKTIEAAASHGAAGTAAPSDDTVVVSRDGFFIDETPPRNEIYLMQTPQCFKYEILLDAHEKYRDAAPATDDCQLVSNAGGKVALVIGDKTNFKITTRDDFNFFEMLIAK